MFLGIILTLIWSHWYRFFIIALVFKNNFSLFCHINQNFNVLLYKSFNKSPSDTKITIMLHRRTHAYTPTTRTHAHTHTHSPETHSHTCRHTHSRKKCAICGLALWTYGAVYIDLLVWVAMQCNNRYVFWRMTSLSLVWATLTYTRPQATNVLYMRPHWHVRITWTLVHTHGNGRNMQLECLKMKVKGEKKCPHFLTAHLCLYVIYHMTRKYQTNHINRKDVGTKLCTTPKCFWYHGIHHFSEYCCSNISIVKCQIQLLKRLFSVTKIHQICSMIPVTGMGVIKNTLVGVHDWRWAVDPKQHEEPVSLIQYSKRTLKCRLI